MPSVLIVDDDPKLLKMLQRTLTYENLTVLTATNGLEALPLVQSQHPDLIILDWMMPKMDGLSFIQCLRDEENKTMILMLTARDAIENRVEGLEGGADDYLVKPFAPAELVARVHAMLRRVESKPESQKASYADVTLDPSTREAKRGDMNLNLTVTEFNLLHLLLRHPRQVLERRQVHCGGLRQDNPANGEIAQYRVYLVENGERKLLGATDASVRTFEQRKLRKGRAYTFEIAAVTFSAREGEAAVLTLR